MHLFETLQSLDVACDVVLDIWKRMNVFCADLIRNTHTHCMELSWFSYVCSANSTHLQDIGNACPVLSTLCSAKM
jgi:hypothetical protein